MVVAQLVIKNPAATSVVHTIVVDALSSIAQLKSRLAVEYPGSPAPTTQKLIFSGRLLQDTDIIADILSQVRARSLSCAATPRRAFGAHRGDCARPCSMTSRRRRPSTL